MGNKQARIKQVPQHPSTSKNDEFYFDEDAEDGFVVVRSSNDEEVADDLKDFEQVLSEDSPTEYAQPIAASQSI